MKFLRDPLFLFLIAAALAWQVHRGFMPPEPVPASAPETVFSAERAAVVLQALYAEEQPHVAGSAANRLLRDRIVATLEAAGYQPEIQQRFHCNPSQAACSPVENIIAVRAGANRQHALLLTAHYDSVAAGPGVADDGAGVAAVLEIARMAALQPEFRYDIVFLFSDAEEVGLVGADAFASHHPLFQKVRTVINLEARGTTGVSIMFESGEHNRRMIRLLSKALEDPAANSLTYEVYRRMPNDTDFSVYRERGLTGFNFAFIGGVQNYHSRLDDLAHLDLGSLQHSGQNAWGSLLALDLRSIDKMISDEDAAYIDLFGARLLQYPVSSSAGIAMVLSVLLIILIRKAFSRQLRFRQMGWALAGALFLLAALPAAGWLLSFPLGRWVDIHALEHPYPWPARLTLWLAAAWLVLVVVRFIGPRTSTAAATLVCWSLYVVLALVLTNWMPSAGFLAVLPMLGLLLGMVLDGLRWRKIPRLLFGSLGGFLAAAYLGFYFYFMLELVVGLAQSWLLLLPLVLPAIAALPLLAWYVDERQPGRAAPAALLILVAAGCVAQWFVPGFTADRPRAMNLVYRDVAGTDAAWMTVESRTSAPDRKYVRSHGFVPLELPHLSPFRTPGGDGSPQTVLARPAPALALPDITLVEAAGRPASAAAAAATAATTATSGGSYQILLEVPEGIEQLRFAVRSAQAFAQIRVNGQLVVERSAGDEEVAKAGTRWLVHWPQPGRLRLEFDGPAASGPFELAVRAVHPLPPEVMQPYLEDWPDTAQPAFAGHRAERDQVFMIQASTR